MVRYWVCTNGPVDGRYEPWSRVAVFSISETPTPGMRVRISPFPFYPPGVRSDPWPTGFDMIVLSGSSIAITFKIRAGCILLFLNIFCKIIHSSFC